MSGYGGVKFANGLTDKELCVLAVLKKRQKCYSFLDSFAKSSVSPGPYMMPLLFRKLGIDFY